MVGLHKVSLAYNSVSSNKREEEERSWHSFWHCGRVAEDAAGEQQGRCSFCDCRRYGGCKKMARLVWLLQLQWALMGGAQVNGKASEAYAIAWRLGGGMIDEWRWHVVWGSPAIATPDA